MGKIFKILGYSVLCYLVLGGLIGVFKRLGAGRGQCSDQLVVSDLTGEHNHQRNWELNSSDWSFCTSFDTQDINYLSAAESRNNISQTYRGNRYPWTDLYRDLAASSKSSIRFLTDSLKNIGTIEKLDRSELAELVVTFVQDIPYSYVLPGDCESYKTNGKPCVGDVTLGIYSPYEFIHTLNGDCDTRSVLIYAILQELAFDPMILISDEYAHAMIALNIPTSGDYILSGGEKYYFWETTAKGWPVGMLPPTTGNKDYWKIALHDEL